MGKPEVDILASCVDLGANTSVCLARLMMLVETLIEDACTPEKLRACCAAVHRVSVISTF